MTDRERYMAACHAMQSGVAFTMEKEPKQVDPKHLRVGVNAAMSDTAAIAELLVAKGVFTEDELWKALADKMEEEVASYAAKFPPGVTLR